jgi:hypothetical protein
LLTHALLKNLDHCPRLSRHRSTLVLSQTLWLGQWSRQYSLHDSKDVLVAYHLFIYCVIALLGIAAMSAGSVASFSSRASLFDRSLTFRTSILAIYSDTVWQYGAVRSGAAIHKRLLDLAFSSTLRSLDVTPQGRIIQPPFSTVRRRPLGQW